jgi:hypothetical protein
MNPLRELRLKRHKVQCLATLWSEICRPVHWSFWYMYAYKKKCDWNSNAEAHFKTN